MTTINTALLIIHVLCVIAILALLLAQTKKSPRKLNPGILHIALTALVAGIAMVGMFATVHPDETLNHTKYGIKILVLVSILILGYRNVKKSELSKTVWLSLIALTTSNFLIALLWH